MYADSFPQRLREAREARSLSLAQLGALVGKTRQAIAQYENGDAKPSPVVFASLIRSLDVPPRFFDRPPITPDLNPIFYRSLKSARERDLAMAQRRLAWLQHTIDCMELYVELPEVDLPAIDPKSDPNDITDADIEAAAQEARRFWRLGDGAITSVIRLLENHGCIVVRDSLGVPQIDAFSQWQYTKHRPIVALSRDDQGVFFREQVSAAHELGHLLLHRRIDKRFTAHSGEHHDIIERQAQRFATALLLPEAAFRQSVRVTSLDAFYLLKVQWIVSIGAIIYRCKDLGMLDDDATTRLWKQRTKRGWNRIEPLDNTTPCETPQMLAEGVAVIREGGHLNAWMNAVCLSPRDIAAFASVEVSDLGVANAGPRLRAVQSDTRTTEER